MFPAAVCDPRVSPPATAAHRPLAAPPALPLARQGFYNKDSHHGPGGVSDNGHQQQPFYYGREKDQQQQVYGGPPQQQMPPGATRNPPPPSMQYGPPQMGGMGLQAPGSPGRQMQHASGPFGGPPLLGGAGNRSVPPSPGGRNDGVFGRMPSSGLPATPPRSAPGNYFSGQDGGGGPGGGDFLSMFNSRGGFGQQPSGAAGGFGGKQDLDMSAFPALGQQLQQGGSRGGPNLGAPSSYQPAGLSFGAMAIGKNGQKREEFNMTQDEFPALPGSSKPKASASPGGTVTSPMMSPMQPPSHPPSGEPERPSLPSSASDSSDPGREKYGLLGLLSAIRATDHDANTLALGSDLTSLGLNLNSPEVLYPSFVSPWADVSCACRPRADWTLGLATDAVAASSPVVCPPPPPPPNPLQSPQLPPCYTVKNVMPIQKVISQLPEDTLFYLFYSKPGDILQQAAASLLYNRDWRYHKEHKVWVTRAPNMKPTQSTTTFERGTYICFQPSSWKKVSPAALA